MQSGVDLQGREDITIKKADGQVFKQTIYNDLDLNIIKELADKIDLVGHAYNSTYQPQHIKIYAKGHAGGDDAEFSTLSLDTKNYISDSLIPPLITDTGTAVTLKFQVVDFVFDGNATDFGGGAPQADGSNTRISKVELIGSNGSTVLGVARATAESSGSDDGHGDLTGTGVAPVIIDDNDLISVDYIITFESSGSGVSNRPWLQICAETVEKAPAGGAAPDPSIKKMYLTHPDPDAPATGTETMNQDVTSKVNHYDSSDHVIVYIGNPVIAGDNQLSVDYPSATIGNPAEFSNVDAANSYPPTLLEVRGVNDVLIGSHAITSLSPGTDLPTWVRGDNIKAHYYIRIDVEGDGSLS